MRRRVVALQSRAGKRVVRVSKCSETYVEFARLYEAGSHATNMTMGWFANLSLAKQIDLAFTFIRF